MYRLLIVDDEEFIVNWLRKLFQDADELDISVAYSGIEALEILNRLKMDIVLTDIRMPGMNGMQLLENISCNWPQCRVIFLTGYSEFDYVYNAIHHENVSFLLKTEKDEDIVRTVEKAIQSIEKSYRDQELVKKADETFKSTLPVLQRVFLNDLLEGNLNKQDIHPQLHVLEIPLEVSHPILLIIGIIDNIPEKTLSMERSRYFYNVKLSADKYMPNEMRIAHLVHRNANMVWLIQPVDGSWNDMQDTGRSWQHIVALFKGALDSIQVSCMESFGLSISFAYSSQPVEWNDITLKYDELRMLLSYKNGLGTGIVLNEMNSREEKAGKLIQKDEKIKKAYALLKRIGIMGSYIETGHRDEFNDLMSSMVESIRETSGYNINLAVEMYYSTAILILSYVNRWESNDDSNIGTDLYRYIGIDENQSLNEALERLIQFANQIFDNQERGKTKNVNEMIAKVKQYVSDHLNEELTLTSLAEYIYLNPSYLSRLFKQSTGGNLKDYILSIRLDKAKELLKRKELKIYEVAVAVGFDYSNYFTSFFKKEIGITPQEFRDSYTK